MKLKQLLIILLICFATISCGENRTTKEEKSKPKPIEEVSVKIDTLKSPIIKNLLYEELEVTEGIEVILAYVHLPKQTGLPAHYHPGEEFAYVIEGSGELTLKDHSKTIVKAGEASKIPLRHIHSFRTLEEAAKLIVFRVHEKGQPHRFLVEE